MTPRNTSFWKVPNVMNDALAQPVQNLKTVECQLRMTYEKLAETEANVYIFNTLKGMNFATNDVKNFVRKQTIHKRVQTKPDSKVQNAAMRSKLSDALAFAKRLRQKRNTLKGRLVKKFACKRSEGRRVLDNLVTHYRNYKHKEMSEAKIKINHILEKEQLDKVVKEAPAELCEYLSNVNIFSKSQHKVKPEPPTGPFICHESIKFDEKELSILNKGPKFMIRSDLDENEFELELEKMVAKKKFNSAFKDKDDFSEPSNPADSRLTSGGNQNESVQGRGNINVENINNERWEEQSSKMVYNLKSKVFDLGNLQASKYKHNKMIYMPSPESAESEMTHEVRKSEMRRVFSRAISNYRAKGSQDKPVKTNDKINVVNSKPNNKIESIESNLNKKNLWG